MNISGEWCTRVPEGEDDEAGDDEDRGESDKDAVAGIPPASIVEHFSRLLRQERLVKQKKIK